MAGGPIEGWAQGGALAIWRLRLPGGPIQAGVPLGATTTGPLQTVAMSGASGFFMPTR